MIQIYSARYTDGGVECDADPATIARAVYAKGVVLLKDVFDPEALARLRTTVFEWSLGVEPQVESEVSFHRIDHLPEKSQTPHIFHAYNLYLREGAIEPKLDEAVRPYFTAMKHLQNTLTKNDADFAPDLQGRFLRPQLLQYPSGGGFFERHVHPFLPQRIGLIAALSQHGVDFETGGTYFEVRGEAISIDSRHDMGDIALFRYDVPHGVTPIDADAELDWRSQRGRWIMALPYN